MIKGHLPCAIALAALLLSHPYAQAQEPSYADISTKQLSDIRTRLACTHTQSAVANTGCSILAEFVAAGSPDAQLLKDSTGLRGRRWLGVTVVIGEADAARHEVPRPSPYFNLIALGARHSDNFHQTIWYENGYAPIYIWPTRSNEIALIEQAAKLLLKDQLDKANPAVQFASKTDLEFVRVKPSTGKSLLLDNEETFLRQSGDALYLVEISTKDQAKPKYCLSRISIRHAL